MTVIRTRRKMDGRLLERRQTLPKDITVSTQRGAKEYERLLLQRLMLGEPLTPQTANSRKRHCAHEPVLSQGVARDVCEDQQQAERDQIQGADHPLSPFAVLRQAASLRNRSSRAQRFKSAQLSKGLSPKTINDQLSVLRRALRSARGVGRDRGGAHHRVDEGAESRLRFSRFRGGRASSRHSPGVPADGRDRIARRASAGRAACPAPHGRRPGQWPDLREAVRLEKRPFGTPKNGLSRRVPISPSLTRILRDHRHLRGELVFCQEDGGLLTGT